jgi:predicted acetyltransferase
MPELIVPTVRLRDSWLEARDEWGPGVHQDGSGMEPTDDYDTKAGFSAWVSRLVRAEDPAEYRRAGIVPCTFRWIVEDDKMLGAVALRHKLNESLLQTGGNLGYGIRPSARRQGLATWAVGEILNTARALGLSRVLTTCNVDNEGSARVIEHHGGVLEDVTDTERGRIKRYWIEL